MTEEWLSALEYGKKVCAVFFDYRKAIYSGPHLPLLKKLETLGFNDHILHWISGYLACRSQSVVSLLCLLLLFLEYHRALFLAPFFF